MTKEFFVNALRNNAPTEPEVKALGIEEKEIPRFIQSFSCHERHKNCLL
jgi:hypothetical protein